MTKVLIPKKDDLAANLLPAIRDTFHLVLMPQKDISMTPLQAQFGSATLGATLARAQIVAERLNNPGNAYDMIGTTQPIVDGLRSFFADPAAIDLALQVRSQQDDYNAALNPDTEIARAIKPYLPSIIPPTERPSSRGFGY